MAIDTLWGGVPIITINTDGTVDKLLGREKPGNVTHLDRTRNVDMGSRIVLSILETLDRTTNRTVLLENLVARSLEEFRNIMISLATDPKLYLKIRKVIVDGVRDQNEPYWHTQSYTALFENGIEKIWNRFLAGQAEDHVYVESIEVDTCDT